MQRGERILLTYRGRPVARLEPVRASRGAPAEDDGLLLDALIRDRVRLLTTDYVIDETCTLTKLRAGPEAAVRFLQLLDATRMLEWEWIGGDRFARARAMFVSQRDQGYSFTDCTSFVVMREERIAEALTSDHHFAIAGFRPLLRPS